MSSFDDVSKMFHSEYEKLVNLINTAFTESDLSLHDIVETYYQIMNMSSMITMLKQQLGSNEHKLLFDEIIISEKLISEKFNHILHPQILQNLEKDGFKEVILAGGAQINTLFAKESLIDEIKLTISPLIFGNGISLFTSELNLNLEIQSVELLEDNLIFVHYKVLK